MNSQRLKDYAVLMRLHKPIGIFLLLWPTLWALWLASAGKPRPVIIILFVMGVIVMRSAGCIINDIADKGFDVHVARTRLRPLATGTISVKEACLLFIFLCAFALTIVLFLNLYTFLLSFIAAILAILYPFLKRITHLPQLGLGLAFAWSVPMAFAATNNAITASAWLIFFAATLWPFIYDTFYAMADAADDTKIGVKSTALLFGKHTVLITGALQIILVTTLCCIGVLFHLSWPYYISLIIASGFFIYQLRLIKQAEPTHCFAAFLNNHWVGLIIFMGIMGSYAL